MGVKNIELGSKIWVKKIDPASKEMGGGGGGLKPLSIPTLANIGK